MSNGANAEISPLAMSDEDFLKMLPPSGAADSEAVVEAEPVAAPVAEEPAAVVDAPVVENIPTEPVIETPVAEAAAVDPATLTDKPAVNNTEQPAENKPAEAESVVAEPAAPLNYEALYKDMMKPFKANGKTIEVRTPQEAIQLMQMGANYTKKLQELQPHRKMLIMLENNGLLDEGKLSYLIDLDKKDPEAIKKLVKDSGIDPLDIDTNTEPTYTQGSHGVSDAEVNFRSVLEEVSSAPGGTEMLSDIDRSWDNASKELLWEKPELLSIIQAQRETGVYALIVGEMDRQRVLGKIPTSTPFLQAYKQVGDELTAAGGFHTKPVVPVAEPKVVATRVAAPKSPVANGDKAGAAGVTPNGTSTAASKPNYLAMSDEEFLKSMAGRV